MSLGQPRPAVNSQGLAASRAAPPRYGNLRSGSSPAGSPLGYFIRPSRDTPTSHFHVRFTNLGVNFADNVNAVGFIRDDDRREFDSALEHTFWITGTTLERLGYDSNDNIYHSQQNVLRSWQIDQSLTFEFRN